MYSQVKSLKMFANTFGAYVAPLITVLTKKDTLSQPRTPKIHEYAGLACIRSFTRVVIYIYTLFVIRTYKLLSVVLNIFKADTNTMLFVL